MRHTIARAIILCAALVAAAQASAATHYSKLAIVTTAKQAGKWDAVKAWIESAGLTDEWQAATYFTDDYPLFVQATNQVVASGVATQAEVDAFLAAARDNSPDALIANAYAADMHTQIGRAKWHGGEPIYTYATNMEERAVYLIETYPDGYERRQRSHKAVLTPEEQALRAAAKAKAAQRQAEFLANLKLRRAVLAQKCADYEAAPVVSNRMDYARWLIDMQQLDRSIELYERSRTNTTTVVVRPQAATVRIN